MNDRAFNVDHPPKVFHNGLQYFDIEVHDGIGYVSLDDGYNSVATSKSLQRSQQGRHRTTVTSSVYDGEWEVHSTLGNVTETVEVYVHGADQISVTENILRLTDAFSQSLYNVRVTMDDNQETWRCFPAEYSIERSQVFAHNKMAVVTLQVPRFPKVTYEVRL